MAHVAEFSPQDKYVHCVVTLIIRVDQLEEKVQLESDTSDQSEDTRSKTISSVNPVYAESRIIGRHCVSHHQLHRSSLSLLSISREDSKLRAMMVLLEIDARDGAQSWAHESMRGTC